MYLQAIEDAVRSHPEGLAAAQIARRLPSVPPRRTLQYRLKALVEAGRLILEGRGRSARYRLARTQAEAFAQESSLPLSKEAADVRAYVRSPSERRRPVGYDRAFLDSYLPGRTFYLTATEREHLRKVATPAVAAQPAGTYARQILQRLLTDLSWNSSRLEGNTYSLLETRRLIELGEEVAGKQSLEAQMILNHKDAIEFLVGAADEIGFNRYTILNLHALLANNLFSDPGAAGRLRRIPVGIERSVFHPLEVPHLIEECFDAILAKADSIEDPFEQALFALVQFPLLQPFDDVNRRVSRLSANIPLIQRNLTPISFDGVPRDLYTDAILGVCELNRIELLRDLFVWACERSAARYTGVRQSLGEPDPFRLRHRIALRELIAAVVRAPLGRKEASAHVCAWTAEHVDRQERARFQETVESELLALHEGNFARYQIRPAEFARWRDVWNK